MYTNTEKEMSHHKFCSVGYLYQQFHYYCNNIHPFRISIYIALHVYKQRCAPHLQLCLHVLQWDPIQ
jgi:hypothetical protein